MGTVSAQVWVAGTPSKVAPLWSVTEHWPQWYDEVEEVLSVSDDYPAVGSTVRWRSRPQGRGEVTETVVEYEPDAGIISEVADGDLTATQTVTFSAVDDGVLVALELDYRLTKRGLFTPVFDRFFVRGAMRTLMSNTVERFAGQVSGRQR